MKKIFKKLFSFLTLGLLLSGMFTNKKNISNYKESSIPPEIAIPDHIPTL